MVILSVGIGKGAGIVGIDHIEGICTDAIPIRFGECNGIRGTRRKLVKEAFFNRGSIADRLRIHLKRSVIRQNGRTAIGRCNRNLRKSAGGDGVGILMRREINGKCRRNKQNQGKNRQ